MSTNRNARLSLEGKYGKGCMFKKADVEGQIAALRTIKTYKTFLKETRYTGKKIRQLERNMTYHHLRHQSEGGKATDENGAVVNELAHRYLHSLPRDEEELINNMLRKYKLDYQLQGSILVPTTAGIEKTDIDIELELQDTISVPVVDDKPKKSKYNRTHTKRQTRQLIEESLDDEEYFDMKQLFECTSDEDVKALYDSKQAEKELMTRLRNVLRAQGVYIKENQSLSLEDRLHQMSILGSFVTLLDNYNELAPIVDNYVRNKKQKEDTIER